MLDTLVGEYDLPVDGLAFSITAHNGKVYAAQTGNPAKEITLYKATDEMLGFNYDRVRLEFMRDGGKFSRMIFKGQFITLEGRRIE